MRQDRIQITVSPLMTIALGVLSERTGLTPSTQAMVLLRQALDRTISTDVVQTRYRAHKAQRNHATWMSDATTDHAVETTLTAFGAATIEEVAHCGTEEAPGGPNAAPHTGGKGRVSRKADGLPGRGDAGIGEVEEQP